MPTLRLWLLCLLLPLSGCGDPAQDRFDVDALSHGEVAVDTLQHPQTQLQGVRELTIGVDSGPEPYAFGRIGGVVADRGGRIIVADQFSHDLRVFDTSGIFLFRFGREGSGPGELRGPCCPVLGPDGAIWVRDVGNRRFNVYNLTDAGADYVRTVRAQGGQGPDPEPVAFSPSGWLIDVSWMPDPKNGQIRTRRHVLDMSGEVIESITLLPPSANRIGILSHASESADRSVGGIFFVPFAARHLMAHARNGDWAEAISSQYLIRWNGSEGEMRSVLWRDAPEGPPVTASERRRAEASLSRLAQETGEDISADIPDRKPPLEALYFDAEGRLWIELTRGSGEPRRAHIVGSTGTWLATVSWPADVRLEAGFISRNVVLGITGNRFGVQRVVRLKLFPGPPP